MCLHQLSCKEGLGLGNNFKPWIFQVGKIHPRGQQPICLIYVALTQEPQAGNE